MPDTSQRVVDHPPDIVRREADRAADSGVGAGKLVEADAPDAFDNVGFDEGALIGSGRSDVQGRMRPGSTSAPDFRQSIAAAGS
jgi:hypothetical protein